MGGPAGGWDRRGERSAHAFARSPGVFPLLCQQLLSWKDFISPVQRATLDASRRRSRPTLARVFSLSPVSKETARAFREIFMDPLSAQCGGRAACFPSTSFALTEIWDACRLHQKFAPEPGCCAGWPFCPAFWHSSGAFE